MSTRSSPRKALPLKAVGTRSSRRLRGNKEDDDDDEWQAVPEEWLNGDEDSKTLRVNGKRGATREYTKATWEDGSEISELTELTEESGKSKPEDDGEDEDEDEDEERKTEKQPVEEEKGQAVLEPSLVPVDYRGLEEQPLPEGFVEWETVRSLIFIQSEFLVKFRLSQICVTLYEWEHIAERFEKATHYTEKALYKVLVNSIVPVVTEELRVPPFYVTTCTNTDFIFSNLRGSRNLFRR